MKVIIAGTRTFNDYQLLKNKVDNILQDYLNEKIIICSGGASGADALGERYATEKGLPLKYFFANWSLYGRGAGPIRNAQMADYADLAICFWDAKSTGTKNMIEQMKRRNKKFVIIFI